MAMLMRSAFVIVAWIALAVSAAAQTAADRPSLQGTLSFELTDRPERVLHLRLTFDEFTIVADEAAAAGPVFEFAEGTLSVASPLPGAVRFESVERQGDAQIMRGFSAQMHGLTLLADVAEARGQVLTLRGGTLRIPAGLQRRLVLEIRQPGHLIRDLPDRAQ